MFAVCVPRAYSLCVCLNVCMCDFVFVCCVSEWVCLVPLVQVVTSAFISLVWGSCSPLRSAPGQQRSRCHQTLQQTHTQSYVHCLIHTVSLPYIHIRHIHKVHIQYIISQTQTHIWIHFWPNTHIQVWTSPNRFCFASYSVTFDPKINIKTQVSPGKHPYSHLCGLHTTDPTA